MIAKFMRCSSSRGARIRNRLPTAGVVPRAVQGTENQSSLICERWMINATNTAGLTLGRKTTETVICNRLVTVLDHPSGYPRGDSVTDSSCRTVPLGTSIPGSPARFWPVLPPTSKTADNIVQGSRSTLAYALFKSATSCELNFLATSSTLASSAPSTRGVCNSAGLVRLSWRRHAHFDFSALHESGKDGQPRGRRLGEEP